MTSLNFSPFDHTDLDEQLRLSGSNLSTITLPDHLGGFDSNLNNVFLDKLNNFAAGSDRTLRVRVSYCCDESVIQKYNCLQFETVPFNGWNHFTNYNQHPVLDFKNFLCSFNGSAHVSRKLLVSILCRFGWFSLETCSKNFRYTADVLDGHIQELVDNRSLYRKFFISDNSEQFFSSINSFGLEKYRHFENIYHLENKLTSSFLHIVSETLATSYYPIVSEKAFYSLVTRGLFLGYAQPGWHAHLEHYFGFRKYSKIFDYRFDTVQNPVERLVELMSMISKFSVLSSDDWRDLYEMEIDTIEHNYDHYFSKNYIKHLEQVS